MFLLKIFYKLLKNCSFFLKFKLGINKANTIFCYKVLEYLLKDSIRCVNNIFFKSKKGVEMKVHELFYIFSTAFVMLFPIMNPIGDGFIVNGFLCGLNNEQKKKVVKKIAINCLCIGLCTLIIGQSWGFVINKIMTFFIICIGFQILVTGISKTFHISIL